MTVERFDLLMLRGEFGQIAMDVFGVAAVGFHLDREVLDAEIVGDALPNGAQQRVGEDGVVSIHQYMGGEHDEAGLHGPDMEIMHVLYAGQRLDRRGDLRRADCGRGGFQQHIERFFEQRPGPVENRADHEETDERIEHRPARQHDRAAAQHDTERDPGIAQHVPKGAADIQIVFRAVLQQQGDAEIGHKAHGGNAHDPPAVHWHRMQQSLESHECNADRRQQQDKRVEKRGNDAGAVIAERAGFAGRLPGENVRIERQKERTLIDEIVSRVTHEADTVEQEAAEEFSGDDQGIQPEREVETGTQMLK